MTSASTITVEKCPVCGKPVFDGQHICTPPDLPKNYGWICPTCGAGNAPWNPRCGCRGFPEYKVTCEVMK